MSEKRTAAVVLAAGRGTRMKSDIPKQFLLLEEKPVIYYSLKVFQESFIDEIILVTDESEAEFCRREIVEKYNLTKVKEIAFGGSERYYSVANGLKAVSEEVDYIFIHDGARPFVTEKILEDAYNNVCMHKACVAAMPVKDTIKIADENGFVISTPRRDRVWQMQTPQVFEAKLIREAYQRLVEEAEQITAAGVTITDDAMVVEYLMEQPVRLFAASYENFKITTPEDMIIAHEIVRNNGLK